MSRAAVWLMVGTLIAIVVIAVTGDALWWHSDWSQFVPDALAALFTGAVVASALWMFERSRIAHDARSTAQREWDAVRERLLLLPLDEGPEYVYVPGTLAELVCFERTAITEITDAHPLHRWQDLLDDPLLPALTSYVRTGEFARYAGTRLEISINAAVHGHLPGSDKAIRTQVVAALVSRCDSRRAAVEGDIAATAYANHFLELESVKRETERFRQSLNDFESAWTTLREQVDSARSR